MSSPTSVQLSPGRRIQRHVVVGSMVFIFRLDNGEVKVPRHRVR